MSRNKGLVLACAALGLVAVSTNESAKLGDALGLPPQVLTALLLLPLLVLLFRVPAPLPAGMPGLRRSLLRIGLLIGMFHVASLTIGGLFSGFGLSPHGVPLPALCLNLVPVVFTLLVIELGRAHFITAFSRDRAAFGVLLAGVAYAAASVPLLLLAHAGSQQEAVGLLGGDWIPLLSQHLLAAFMVYLGGPGPAIAYRGILEAFYWLSPVLPDLSWGLKSLIGTIIPVFGLMLVHSVSVGGIRGERRQPQSFNRTDLPGWVVGSACIVVLIWFFLGLMPVYPTVVAGGSMSPTMEYGDLVVSAKVNDKSLDAGDVIEFHTDQGPVIHRVIEVCESEQHVEYITRGDANNSIDAHPVVPAQVRGKVILVIPRAGWLTIALRNAM
jgi:signal peptidase